MNSVSIRGNFISSFLANVVYAGCQWGILVVIAKMGTPEILGSFTLAIAITSPIVIGANLNLRGFISVDVNNKYKPGEYISIRIIMLIFAAVITIIWVLLNRYENDFILVIMAVLLAKIIDSFSDLFFGFLQQQEKIFVISTSLIAKGFLSLVSFFIGLHFFGQLYIATFGMFVSWTIILIFYDLPKAALCFDLQSHRRFEIFEPTWSKKSLTDILLTSLPLGATTLLSSLFLNIPRYYIENSFGLRESGFFAAMVNVTLIGTQVVKALGNVTSPRLAKFFSSKDIKSFKNLFIKMCTVGIGLLAFAVVVAIMWGHEVLAFFYGTEYTSTAEAFILITISAGIGYVAQIIQFGITASRCFRPQPILLLISTAVLAFACSFLVPSYGINGASVSMIIASLFQLFGSVYILYSTINVDGDSQ